jgi:choline dehydrogenase-like flavoprotein
LQTHLISKTNLQSAYSLLLKSTSKTLSNPERQFGKLPGIPCRPALTHGNSDWVLSEYHPIGTCAMGSALDSRLRVKGVSGLRVVDASVFPNNVSGNIVSSVYATAEKAADIIKADYSYVALQKAVK